ncbi:MAG: hypothetical protein J7K66_03060 [Anaerolineaceae bacterium]|nr:hypothetical protein [Anaerolineaceae bacterium]
MAREKLSILLELIFIIMLLPSCCVVPDVNVDPLGIGSVGPFLIDKEKIPFDVDEDINIKINPLVEFTIDNSDNALMITPAEPLEIGKEYQVTITKNALDFVYKRIIRQPCLLYLGNVASEPEIWRLCGQEKLLLTQTQGNIVDYAVSRNGNWITYAVKNGQGGSDVWKMDREGKKKENVYSCGEFICSNLAIDPLGLKIAFSLQGPDRSLILLSLREDQITLLERGNTSNVDFSPNGQFLRYFEKNQGYLRVINLNDKKQIQTVESETDLIGSWKSDSSSFLFGMRNYWGGIADIDIFESNAKSGTFLKLFNNQKSSFNVFQPTYFGNKNLIVLARTGFTGSSKQIWVINEDGKKIFEITNDYQYDYSGISWNSAKEELAFQRYLLAASDSRPEVWIWEKQGSRFQLIAQNAAHAIWIP